MTLEGATIIKIFCTKKLKEPANNAPVNSKALSIQPGIFLVNCKHLEYVVTTYQLEHKERLGMKCVH